MSSPDIIVTPTRWSARGEAVVPGDRRPLMVWQGIPGETALVRVVHRGENRSLAHWVRAREDDPHRRQPPCRSYSPCGGCPLMHVDQEAQARARLELLQTELDYHGLGGVPISPLVYGPDGDEGYRHVARLLAGYSDIGRLRLGAPARHTRAVTPIPHCRAVTGEIREGMKTLAHHMIRLKVETWDQQRRRGLLRYVVIRQSRATGELLVTLVATRWHRSINDLAEAAAEGCRHITGIHLHLNETEGSAIMDRDAPPAQQLLGKRVIRENIGAYRLELGPEDFFQTNPGVAPLLFGHVLDKLPGDAPVVDLYSGVGSMTIMAAARFGWALGVESVAPAVERARASATLNGAPAEFMPGRVEEVLPAITRRLGGRAPALVVNPPRSGLAPGLPEALMELRPRRLVYVSCNPRSLARDLASLKVGGLTLTSLAPFDMFPNTPHQEVVAVLEGEGPRGARPPRRRRLGTA